MKRAQRSEEEFAPCRNVYVVCSILFVEELELVACEFLLVISELHVRRRRTFWM